MKSASLRGFLGPHIHMQRLMRLCTKARQYPQKLTMSFGLRDLVSIEILHYFIYLNHRSYGSVVYIGPCGSFIINRTDSSCESIAKDYIPQRDHTTLLYGCHGLAKLFAGVIDTLAAVQALVCNHVLPINGPRPHNLATVALLMRLDGRTASGTASTAPSKERMMLATVKKTNSRRIVLESRGLFCTTEKHMWMVSPFCLTHSKLIPGRSF